jgi:hypothetical protein
MRLLTNSASAITDDGGVCRERTDSADLGLLSAALAPSADHLGPRPRSIALSRAACRVRWSRSGRLGACRAASA